MSDTLFDPPGIGHAPPAITTGLSPDRRRTVQQARAHAAGPTPTPLHGPAATPRVIGLDLSLSSTGLADSNCNGGTATKTILSPPSGADVKATAARLKRIVREIAEHITHEGPWPALIVIEGPSYNSRGAGTWDRAGLWWLVVRHVLTYRLAVVPPAVLKKYATGRGNADKTAMAVALHKRCGLELRDDNKVDAFWLMAMGLDQLGHPPVPMPQAHRDALTKVSWPEVRS